MHADNHQRFLQVGFNSLGTKVSYKMILSLSSTLKVLKVTSLQYLYNISKKKIVIKLFNKNKQNFTGVVKYFNARAVFVFCCDAKHSNILLVKHKYFTWKGASFFSRKGFIFSWEWHPMEGICFDVRVQKSSWSWDAHTHIHSHAHAHICMHFMGNSDYNMQWCVYKKIPFQHQKFF